MNRQVQEVGTRQWFGSDLQMLQDSAFKALEDSVLADIGVCVLKEPEINSSNEVTAAGYIYIDGKICKINTGQYTNPVWFTASKEDIEKVTYDESGNGVSKAKVIEWTAEANATTPLTQQDSVKYYNGVDNALTLQEAIARGGKSAITASTAQAHDGTGSNFVTPEHLTRGQEDEVPGPFIVTGATIDLIAITATRDYKDAMITVHGRLDSNQTAGLSVLRAEIRRNPVGGGSPDTLKVIPVVGASITGASGATLATAQHFFASKISNINAGDVIRVAANRNIVSGSGQKLTVRSVYLSIF